MLAGNNGSGQSTRRKRPVISCRECHRRKEKCDRRQPCTRCIKRGKRNACLYELDDGRVRSASHHVERDHQPMDSKQTTRLEDSAAASSLTGEAWHTLGIAIRDAQELGLHRVELESPLYLRNEDPERDLGSKLWLMLHLWDAHMAIVLGRPMSTRLSPNNVPFPALCDSIRSPRPRDVILCGYHTAHKFLQDIHDLETMDDCRLMVQNIHDTLLTNIANLPAWANPQRSCQDEPHWLSVALEVLFTNIQFVLFALHRPFVFVDASNRANAVHAATQILESQKRLFDQAESLQYKAFSFVFATFDAMVLIAAVHIRFPDELMDQVSATIANFEEVLSRLKVLQASNKLASPGYNVLQRLYGRLLAITTPTESSRSSSGNGEGNGFSGMETEMAYVDWDALLQPDLENVLCPQPLNHLLCNGDSVIHPSLQTKPVYERDGSQFEFLDNSQAIPSI